MTAAEVALAVFNVLGGAGGPNAYTVEIHAIHPKSEDDGVPAAANGFSPFAFVNTNAETPSEAAKHFASEGVVIHGVACEVKQRCATKKWAAGLHQNVCLHVLNLPRS